jgi:hypothetical protein
MGQFWAVLVRMEDRRECSDRKIVSRRREQARRVYYGAVFEIKKEIPVDDDAHVLTPAGVRPSGAKESLAIAAIWLPSRRELHLRRRPPW